MKPMTKHFLRGIAAPIVLALMTSCGGGGGGGGGGGTATSLSGSFVDGPVMGVHFSASPSGITGTTDPNGGFQYKAGDTVTFTLDVGSGGSVMLGTWTAVAAPGGGTAYVQVLSLDNGLTVAQVLQSLNHGSSTAMDVSGLTLPSGDVTSLNSFIVSGGIALPAGTTTDVGFLGSVQGHLAGLTFVIPGGASVSTTIANIVASLQGLTTSSANSLAAVLPGSVVFEEGAFVANGQTGVEQGIIDFKSDGTTTVAFKHNGGVVAGPNYGISGNVLTFTQAGTVTDTIKVSYLDPHDGLWSDTQGSGSTGGGLYAFLQTDFGTPTIAGRTLTLTGSLKACGGTALQVVVATTGMGYSANCEGQPAGSQGTGTVAATSIPGVLVFTEDATGAAHYAGLLVGGSITHGSMAVVGNGILGVTSN
jgi:hypothetical protein